MPAAFLAASRGDGALDRAGGLRALGGRGAGDGNAGRRLRSRRRARDRAGPAGRAPHERTGLARPAGGRGCAWPRRSARRSRLGASARIALGARARAHVERHFSLERMVSSTLDVYSALLEGRFPRRTS